jgi:transcription initiation factor IIE alpha subunit
MAWFIVRQTTAEYQAIYISGTPGMDEDEVERELQNLARLQAIEAAARRVLTDGHTESPYYMDLRDHDEALEALLREVVTSIEFDELGLGTLREKIERLLVKP